MALKPPLPDLPIVTVVHANFGAWYVNVTAFYLITCLGLALWPATGARRLGQLGERLEFSNFSWFSVAIIKVFTQDGLRAQQLPANSDPR